LGAVADLYDAFYGTREFVNVVLMDSGLSPARLQNLMGFPAATVRDSKSKSKAPALQEAPGMHFIGNPNRSSEHHRERDGVTHA
jgi:hypothetical protein